MEPVSRTGQDFTYRVALQVAKRARQRMPALPPPKSAPRLLPPPPDKRKRDRFLAGLKTLIEISPPAATGRAAVREAQLGKAIASETWEKPATKKAAGNFLIGVTALAALVALGGFALSAGGVNQIHVGSLRIPIDVSKLASIAFYSGTGALIGLQLKRGARLKEKEEKIQHKLDETERQISELARISQQIAEDTADVEEEVLQLLQAIKKPAPGEVRKAVAELTTVPTSQPLLPARTDAPRLSPPSADSHSGTNQLFRDRLTKIYKTGSVTGHGESTLKRITLLAGIGFLSVFGLQLYSHFSGTLPFKAFGLYIRPSLLASTTVLMYALSLLDLGLSSPEKAPMQVKKGELSQKKRELARKETEQLFQTARLSELKRQRSSLRGRLQDLQFEIDTSQRIARKQKARLEEVEKPTKPEETTLATQVKDELSKPGVGAHLTKGVMIGATLLTLLAVGGLGYSFTGSHKISVFGNVTEITPKAMGMIAFYAVGIVPVAQQILAKMKTQKQIDAEKKELEELKQKVTKAQNELKVLAAKKGQGDPDLQAIQKEINERLAATNRLAKSGHLFQKGVGAIATLAGLVVLAYVAYAMIDRTGASRTLLEGRNINLLTAAILASNGFSALYAGVSLWQNAAIKEREEKRESAEKDLESRLLQADIERHRHNLEQKHKFGDLEEKLADPQLPLDQLNSQIQSYLKDLTSG